MADKEKILLKIRKSIELSAPGAKVILYGSYARGSYKEHSDIDILILLDKDIISREDEIRIKYPLYDIEFDTGQIISPLVLSKSDWESQHKITPFYENVMREGVPV